MNIFFVKKESVEMSRKNLVGCKIGNEVTFCKDCLNGKKPVCSFLKHILAKNIRYKKFETKARERKNLDVYTRAFA